jgi:hypothetical protein
LGLVLSTSAQQNPTQVTVSSAVTCVSTGDQRQHCPANTSAGVVILRQSSETNCLHGRNWGYDAQGVWVSEGCGGEFATGSTSRSAAVPGEANAYVEPVDQKAAMATVTTGTNREVHYTGMFNAYGSIRNIVGISDAGAQVSGLRNTAPERGRVPRGHYYWVGPSAPLSANNAKAENAVSSKGDFSILFAQLPICSNRKGSG